MLRLWIDERECDVATVPPIPLAYSVERLTDIERAREGRTIELVLPATPANNAVLGSSRDLYATERFNTQPHTARLAEGGVTIFEGAAYLISTTLDTDFGGDYTLRIVDGGEAWVKGVARTKLEDLDLPFEGRLNPNTIDGLALGTMWKGIVPLNKDGKVLHNSIIWLDARAEDQAKRLNAHFGKELFVSSDYWPKLMWLRENHPEVIEEAEVILETNAYLKWKATGTMTVDISNSFLRSVSYCCT